MAEDLAATEQPPAAAERSDAAAEAGLVDQVAERNRQLKAALMDDQPEVVVETPGSVQDQDGIAATTSPAPASEPPAALQKQNSTKRPLARQESAADQRAAAADQRAAAAAERATERAAAAAAAEKLEAQKQEKLASLMCVPHRETQQIQPSLSGQASLQTMRSSSPL